MWWRMAASAASGSRSVMARAMASCSAMDSSMSSGEYIVADDAGHHDFLYAPCSQEMYEIGYGVTDAHPNCLDNLTSSLATFGVPAATVTIAFNVFMRVDIAADGRLTIAPPTARAGQAVTFVAERDVIVAVTACPAAKANGGRVLPLGVEIGAG